MKLLEYNSIISFVEGHASKCSRIVLADLVSSYNGEYPYHTLLSIFLNRLQRKLRASYRSKTKKENLKLYYRLFSQQMFAAKGQGLPSSDRLLIDLAIQFDLPPCIMARLILEQYLLDGKLVNQPTKEKVVSIVESSTKPFSQTVHAISNDASQVRLSSASKPYCDINLPNGDASETAPASRCNLVGNQKCDQGNDTQLPSPQLSNKSKISSWIKDPYLIPDIHLRDQVLQCVSYDVCYGPINDAIRHSVGLEFEEKLKEDVTKLNLPFLDENDLRKRGYDKTPDVKLEIPIAISGRPVCWIESKASFGDLETHNEYLHAQYYSYWNRFGPGLVIYWFGFIEELSDEMLKQGIIIMDSFPSPDDVTFMDPS